MISMYFSIDKNGSIGFGRGSGSFPEAILKYTKKELNGKIIIMSRIKPEDVSTFFPDSALLMIKDREDYEYNALKKTLVVVDDFSGLMTLLFEEQDVVIVGGRKVFLEAEPYVDFIQVNKFDGVFESAEIIFPEEFDWSLFNLVYQKTNEEDSRITHLMYTRKEL